MASLRSFTTLLLIFSLNAQAEEFDKKDNINGVELASGKKDSTRTYQGLASKSIMHPIAIVMKGVTNFAEKCNNAYKDKRKYTNKAIDCKYHNENMVESFVIQDIRKDGWTIVEGEVERFLIGRQVYNRGHFGYYELVQVFHGKNKENQQTYKIVLRMLENSEAKAYVEPKFEKESAFDKSSGVFTLTEVGPSETKLTYKYMAETDHWVLNKEMSVPQVFASITKSINDLVKTVDMESVSQTRELASQK